MDGRKSEKMRHREQICEILGGVDTDRPPLVHGHMMKRNTSRPMFNKRYFALYEGVLIYYHHEKDYKKDKKNGMVCIVCHIHTLHVIQSYEVLLMCKCLYCYFCRETAKSC